MIYDTAVIGGGAVGMLTALRLAKAGEEVILLEAGSLGKESSWAGGGILSPLYPWRESPAILELTSYSLSLFSSLCQEIQQHSSVDPEYHQSGMLILEPGPVSEWSDWASQNSAELIDSNELYHGLASGKEQPGLLIPWVKQIRSPRLIQGLIDLLEAYPIHVKQNCPVRGFQTKQNQLTSLTCEANNIHARRFVVTAGAWTNQIDTDFNEFEVVPIRGQMLLYYCPNIELKHIIMKDWCYIIPRLDGHILVGSTVEDVGFDPGTTDGACNQLAEMAATIVPEFARQKVKQRWAGLRPKALNGNPVIGRSKKLTNLYYNCGHYRIGITLGPASAELLFQQMNDQTLSVDPYPFQLQ